MADTDTETLPNGTGHLLTAASNEDEEERMKQRPADIDADVREMERRKRVEALMSSKLFREELERVLDQQMHEGSDAPLLQRIREMVGGRLHTGSLRGPSCVLPINDIRGIEGVGYEKGEKILRCKLAAVYRLVDLFGWTQTGVSGQITARLNTAVEQVLTTPRGLLPHEVTASSLVKVDMQGVVQDQGTTNFPVNAEGFSLHASVHAARPDVRCVLHVRSAAALAVSATRRGLLPLCAEAALLGPLAQHRTPHGNLDNEERDKLVRALGPSAKAKNLNAACEVQLRLGAQPPEELHLLDEETRRQIYESSRKPPADAGKWRVGGEEFEALMRMLDNAGFRTGYIYRHPLVKNDVPKPKNDVEVPPAVSSLGYLLEEEELYRQGLWKKGQGKTGERTRWLNSPNVYQKVEVLETGTSDPKKITKWVQDGSPAHSSTPVKIDTLQFVPKNTNPKEFKQLQQQIKENRRADKISAGPQSHILEGVTWDEAARLVGEDAANTHTGDHVVLMGAASKGIIQRGYQHNATMYSAPYARNPFDHVTDREIDEYKRTVERKQRGNEYDTDLSESEAVSGAQITSPASAPSETEEESRDEHRVLRIETKQVPVRSQPELVLSDVDTTDFLKAERDHADMTREPERDPNLLSDDEVFLDSTASTGTSSVIVPATSTVVVRQYTAAAAVQGAVGRGQKGLAGDGGKLTTERVTLEEALASNSRSKHGYSRNPNIDDFILKFDSSDIEKHPKCKTSLNLKLNSANCTDVYKSCELVSGTSLSSIPSIDSDLRVRGGHSYCTHSLPRQRVRGSASKIYRTRSYSGFVNSYIRDPVPNHFHLPEHRTRCSSEHSDGYIATDSDLSKYKSRSSLYYSLDNIDRKFPDEHYSEFKVNVVRVLEKSVPVYQVDLKPAAEFVESQEFTEDNYLDDMNDSLSTENQTVVENRDGDAFVKRGTSKEGKAANIEIKDDRGEKVNNDISERDVDNANPSEISTVEGEYHSFQDDTDYEEAVYDSPVKKLMEKDIRDYSVPIDFFCSDYGRSNAAPPKSPRHDMGKIVLEPILEESKSSNSDDSNVSNIRSENKASIDTPSDVGKVCAENNSNNELESDKENMKINPSGKLTSDSVEKTSEVILNEHTFRVPYKRDKTKIDDKAISAGDRVRSSCNSLTNSDAGHSFDSTAEFEKFEVVTEVLGIIINRINFEISITTPTPPNISENNNFEETDRASVDGDTFSIVQIVESMERHVSLDSTDLTDASDANCEQTHGIVEAIVYYVFDAAFYFATHRHKRKDKPAKQVVTVADSEDILFTTAPQFLRIDTDAAENVAPIISEIVEVSSRLDKSFNFEGNEFLKEDEDKAIENISNIKMDMDEKATDDNLKDLLTSAPDKILHGYGLEIRVDNFDVNDSEWSIQCQCSDTLEGSEEVASIRYALENSEASSVATLQGSVEETTDPGLNETFTLTTGELGNLNTAFVEDTNDTYSRSSSPRRWNSIMDRCTESPILNTDASFAGSELSVPYEKDDTILGSPFIRRAPVIAMSQTENSRGVKYWLSFDDSITESSDRPGRRSVKITQEDKKMPSFLSIDCGRGRRRTADWNTRKLAGNYDAGEGNIDWTSGEVRDCGDEEVSRDIPVGDVSQDWNAGEPTRNWDFGELRDWTTEGATGNWHIAEFSANRNCVLLKDDRIHGSVNSTSYNTASPSNADYTTCESSTIGANDTKVSERLIYDSRADAKRSGRRLYSSWPPYEETLLYRIISQFRMSESFDPSSLQLDSSL
ncbi:unnamed protein product, partial [Iphiclides podalirius]